MQSTHRLVPEFIYQKYRAGEVFGTFQGAAMFADLSGFSTMTDVLSAYGAHGAEVLADMMRVVFEPLVNSVEAQGGFVIGYAGDAFNAVFPAEKDEIGTMQCCLAAAWEMQSYAKSRPLVSTPYGDFHIRVKIGIGFGSTTWQIFKSINGRHASYWFRGQSLNGAVEAEESAQAGQVVADPISYRLLQDVISVVTPLGNHFLIEEIREAELPAPQPIPPLQPVDELVEAFFVEAVTRLPIAGEFRQVVNLFIDIPAGISDAALIKPFMETVYLLQEQYGGFFLRPDLGDKGFNLLMFWGAPIAHENDVDRALNFLIELSTRTGITLRAGISYQLAYTGFIGSSRREDYTAYGWGVTLAARMMARAAMGEYWMGEETARRAAKHFNIRPLGEYTFKGFKQKQRVFALVGRKNLIETVYQGQFVGRGRELAALSEFIEPLKHQRFAGVMTLKGEAGIGKSRLVHSFQTSYFHDFPAYWAVCQTDEILRLPFNPFADWVKKYFQLAEDKPEKANRAQFSQALQKLIDSTPEIELAAELTRTSSALAALVNISMPGSLYESLDAKGRYENTLIALSVFLRAQSLQMPLILFLEDTHWLDEASRDFLSHFGQILLTERQYPIAIIATQRPEGESPWEADQLPAREIHLDKLTSGDLSQLAADILSSPISASLQALLESRAEGNPFFAEQILRYLAEQNALVLDSDGKYFAKAEAEISLPTDVRSVLVARLDRLTQQVREMVQTASVLGREFEVRVLGEMLRADCDFSSHLVQAEHADIWSALSEVAYIFRHALLRDAAYSMQLLARQRELHGLAVSAMESVYAASYESHYGELAYHAEKAELTEKALHYLTQAGKLALAVYQNQQAVDYFTRALAILPAEDLRTSFDLLILRVEGYYNLSNHEEQARDLDVLESLASQLKDDGLLARAYMRRAYYFIALSGSQNALKYALLSKDLAETAREIDVILALFTIIPSALLRLGRISEAMQYATDGLAFAQNVKHHRGEGNILSLLGLVSLEKEGAAVAIHHHEQALLIGREIKDKYLEAMALSNLATAMATSQGDYSTALEYYEQAYSIACELGNNKGQAITLSNMGWLNGILGNYPSAMEFFKQALAVMRRISERSQSINVYVNLSAIAGGQGDAANALKWAGDALSLSTELGDQTGRAWAWFYLGYAHWSGGQFDAAIQAFTKCIEIREKISAPVLVAEAHAGLLGIHFEMEDRDSTQSEIKWILEYMASDETFEGAEDPFRIFWTLYQALQKIKDPRAMIVLQNAIQLLNAQVSKLRLQAACHSFVHHVPWRFALYQAAKENGLTD